MVFIDLNFPVFRLTFQRVYHFPTLAVFPLKDSNMNLVCLPTPSHSWLDPFFSFSLSLCGKGAVDRHSYSSKSHLVGACLKTFPPFTFIRNSALCFSNREAKWSKEPTTWKWGLCLCGWCPPVSGCDALRISSGNSARSHKNWGV